MTPDVRFLSQPKSFWAHVRALSQHIGYTDRAPRGAKGEGRIKTHTIGQICDALLELGLESNHLLTNGAATQTGQLLVDYFIHRARVLTDEVEPNLMDAAAAAALYAEHAPNAPAGWEPPMNKQKGDMRAPAYLTALVNLTIEANLVGNECCFDPRELTSVTLNGMPLRTLARRVDGAFPAVINPVAVWEVKEYYYTTSFGSRVADGVYETLLDGMELEELRDSEGIDVKHYLMLDAYYTWWNCGKSYLCRMVDMLHMGYVDEILVGREVVARLPALVAEWIAIAEVRAAAVRPVPVNPAVRLPGAA